MRSTTEVLHDHLVKRLEGRVDDDIEANYADDVVLLGGSGDYRGRSGIRESADELARLLPDVGFEYEQTVLAGPYAYLEWAARRDGRLAALGADSFVIEQGRIVMQTVHFRVVE
jgi:hypothetical protein